MGNNNQTKGERWLKEHGFRQYFMNELDFWGIWKKHIYDCLIGDFAVQCMYSRVHHAWRAQVVFSRHEIYSSDSHQSAHQAVRDAMDSMTDSNNLPCVDVENWRVEK